MSVLGGGGGQTGIAALASAVGLGSTDPSKMSADDGARLMNYVRKEHPEALRQTVEEKPWLIKALGNPIVLGALTMAATKLLSNQQPK
jgi:hypothetical protein